MCVLFPLLREGNGTQAPAPTPARPASSRGPNNGFSHLNKLIISLLDALVCVPGGGGDIRAPWYGGGTHMPWHMCAWVNQRG